MARFFRRRGWMLALAVSGSTCLVSWWHAILNDLHRPFTGPLDTMMHIVEGVGKPLTFVAVILMLRAANVALHQDPRLTRRYFFAGVAGVALLVATLAALRPHTASLLSDAVFKHFPLKVEPGYDMPYPGREEWVPRWNRGEIWLIEILLGVVAAALIAFASYRWGNLKRTTLILVPLLLLLTLSWPNLFGLIVSDFDFFAGGVYSDSLFFDTLIFFLPMGSTTTVALTVWFMFIASSVIGIWPKLRPTPAPPSSLAAIAPDSSP